MFFPFMNQTTKNSNFAQIRYRQFFRNYYFMSVELEKFIMSKYLNVLTKNLLALMCDFYFNNWFLWKTTSLCICCGSFSFSKFINDYHHYTRVLLCIQICGRCLLHCCFHRNSSNIDLICSEHFRISLDLIFL